jgi:hypothetical protein
LIRKKHTDYLTFTGEYVFSLREYPVRKILAVYAAKAGAVMQGEALFGPENLVDPKHYYCLPDEGIREDIPFSLVLRPPFRLTREEMGIQIWYLAGYVPGKAPDDLASTCLELVAWNMARYRGVAYRDGREHPGEREGRGISGNLHAEEWLFQHGIGYLVMPYWYFMFQRDQFQSKYSPKFGLIPFFGGLNLSINNLFDMYFAWLLFMVRELVLFHFI